MDLESSQDTSLYIQRAYNIKSKSPVYGEVLVRKYKGIDGIFNILEFIKKNKLEKDFDLDILELALKIKRDNNINIPISINLMPESIKINNITEEIVKIVKDYNVDTSEIIIEITEETDFCDKTVTKNIDKLHEYGFKIALDDFGVEKSNMVSLLTNKFDSLKVDKCFVDFMFSGSEEAMYILKHIRSLCDALNISCCIEGVENNEQLEILDKINYNVIQGYLFEKPFPMNRLIGEQLCG